MRIRLFRSGNGIISDSGLTIDFTLPMTVPIFLNSLTPTVDTELVTKAYVDNKLANTSGSSITGVFSSARLPMYTGLDVSSSGNGIFTLSNVGTFTGEYTKYTVDSKGRIISASQIGVSDLPSMTFSKLIGLPTTLAGYGITDVQGLYNAPMTGYLSLNNQPTIGSHIATKLYVDTAFNGVGVPVAYQTGDIVTRSSSKLTTGFLRANGGMVSKAKYTPLYLAIGDRFDKVTRQGSGRPWTQQYEINSASNTQLSTPIAVNAVSDLPHTGQTEGVSQHQVLVTKNYMYVVGGTNSNGTSNQHLVRSLNSNGTDTAWTASTLSFTTSRSASVVVNDRFYLIGGREGTAPVNTVRSVYIPPATGLIDPNTYSFQTELVLPAAVEDHQAIALKDRVYVIGGRSSTGATLTTVLYSDIQSDNSWSSWKESHPLPISLASFSVAVTKNRLYVIGGFSDTLAGKSAQVYYANIQPNGVLSTWIRDRSDLPIALTGHSTLVTNSKVFIFGGITSTGFVANNNTYSTTIQSDGSLDVWVLGNVYATQEDAPTVGFAYGQVASVSNYLYFIGGTNGSVYPKTIRKTVLNGGMNDYSAYTTTRLNFNSADLQGAGQPWKQFGNESWNITDNHDVTIDSTWITSVALPFPVTSPYVYVTENKVYVMGGKSVATGLGLDKVQTAIINPDGSIGSWQVETWTLPNRLSNGGSVILPTNSFAYMLLVAGLKNDTATTSDLFGYKIDPAQGSALTATPLTNFVFAPSLKEFAIVATKTRVYTIGGLNTSNTPVSSTYSAIINSDGTMGQVSVSYGEFLSDAEISYAGSPVTMARQKVAQVGDFVFLLGGVKNGVYNSDIYRYSIAADGSLRGLTKITGSSIAYNNISDVYVVENRIFIFSESASDSIGVLLVDKIGNISVLPSIPTVGVTAGSVPFVFATSSRLYAFGNGYNHYLDNRGNGRNSYLDSYYRDPSLPTINNTSNSQYFSLPDLTGQDSVGSYSYIKT